MDYALIGSMEARHHGTVLDLGGLKQRTVLAVLLLARGRAVEIDRIVDNVWNDAPPHKAVSSLRAYVSNLRRILDTRDEPHRHRLITSADGYRLELGGGGPNPDTVDVDFFDRLCTSARDAWAAGDAATAERAASAAMRFWRGAPLADFRDHRFAYDETQRLEQLYAEAFDVRVDALMSRGAHGSVVPDLESRLRFDPLRETLWVRLMLALHRSGRRADALAAFDRARNTLATELGIEPGEELVRTNDEVSGRRPTPADTPHRTVFGRDRELDTLNRLLREARAGRGRIVSIIGDSGLGKTALASEVSADAQGAGFVTAWSTSSDNDAKPLLEGWTRVLRRLADDGRDVPSSTTAHATAIALRGAVGTTPTLIVLDDFHHADSESHEVLIETERWIATAPLVVVTTRLDEGRNKGVGTVLPLTGLDEASVAALIEHFGGIVPSPNAVARILIRTGGNPSHVRDVVRLLRTDSASGCADDDRAEAN